MKKASLFLMALVAVAMVGSTALAQDSVLWMDIRNNTGEQGTFATIWQNQNITLAAGAARPFANGQEIGDVALNSGRRGDGQVLRITANHSTGWHTSMSPKSYADFDGDNDQSTGDLWLYMDVNPKCSVGDVISSVGIDLEITDNFGPPADPRNRIASAVFSWEPMMTDDASNEGAVDGASDAGDPPNWLGAKAVKVPVNAIPEYDATGGLTPSADPYRIGKLRITAGARACGTWVGHANKSTFNVHLRTNNLLITRTCDNEDPGAEMVALGYTAGAPEAPAVNGSLDDQTSTEPDAVIQIRMKGDSNGDGRVRANDVPGFIDASGAGLTLKQIQCYLHDYTGDRRVRTTDVPGLIAASGGSGTCP